MVGKSHLLFVVHVRHKLDLLEPLFSLDFRSPLPLFCRLSILTSLNVSSLQYISVKTSVTK